MDNKETDKSQMNGSMKDMNQLHLEKITYLNWHDAEDLLLTKEQKNYLPDNVSNLALAGVIREASLGKECLETICETVMKWLDGFAFTGIE